MIAWVLLLGRFLVFPIGTGIALSHSYERSLLGLRLGNGNQDQALMRLIKLGFQQLER